jgi:hypothetical protein
MPKNPGLLELEQGCLTANEMSVTSDYSPLCGRRHCFCLSSPVAPYVWTFFVRTRTLLAGVIILPLLTWGSVQAENIRRDRLVALLSDPGSDLSGLKGDHNLQAAAALDARLYFKKYNNREYRKDCLGIGLEHAVKHHLKGKAVDVYALAFDADCSAFFAK